MVSSIYAHPLEFVIGNVFPSMASLMILKHRMHAITFIGWLILRLIETNDGHSGYEFPISMFKVIPFMSDPNYHNYHHMKNIGNYGSFTSIWDTIFGTNKEFLKYAKEAPVLNEESNRKVKNKCA
jgi:sterol desaturase/sphingolipid hydroxylase (fatty acid hydroxylase superfamily)